MYFGKKALYLKGDGMQGDKKEKRKAGWGGRRGTLGPKYKTLRPHFKTMPLMTYFSQLCLKMTVTAKYHSSWRKSHGDSEPVGDISY